jgi:hypothetical protein
MAVLIGACKPQLKESEANNNLMFPLPISNSTISRRKTFKKFLLGKFLEYFNEDMLKKEYGFEDVASMIEYDLFINENKLIIEKEFSSYLNYFSYLENTDQRQTNFNNLNFPSSVILSESEFKICYFLHNKIYEKLVIEKNKNKEMDNFNKVLLISSIFLSINVLYF